MSGHDLVRTDGHQHRDREGMTPARRYKGQRGKFDRFQWKGGEMQESDKDPRFEYRWVHACCGSATTCSCASNSNKKKAKVTNTDRTQPTLFWKTAKSTTSSTINTSSSTTTTTSSTANPSESVTISTSSPNLTSTPPSEPTTTSCYDTTSASQMDDGHASTTTTTTTTTTTAAAPVSISATVSSTSIPTPSTGEATSHTSSSSNNTNQPPSNEESTLENDDDPVSRRFSGPEYVQAVRFVFFGVVAMSRNKPVNDNWLSESRVNHWMIPFPDPVLLGQIDKSLLKFYGTAAPFMYQGDFVGILDPQKFYWKYMDDRPFKCPKCKGNLWRDGTMDDDLVTRTVFNSQAVHLSVLKLRCDDCIDHKSSTFAVTDPDVWCQLPPLVRDSYPFSFAQRNTVTLSDVDSIVSAKVHKASFAAVATVTQQVNQFEMQRKLIKFLELVRHLKKNGSVQVPEVNQALFDTFNGPPCHYLATVPSVKSHFLHSFSNNEPLIQRGINLSLNRAITLAWDHQHPFGNQLYDNGASPIINVTNQYGELQVQDVHTDIVAQEYKLINDELPNAIPHGDTFHYQKMLLEATSKAHVGHKMAAADISTIFHDIHEEDLQKYKEYRLKQGDLPVDVAKISRRKIILGRQVRRIRASKDVVVKRIQEWYLNALKKDGLCKSGAGKIVANVIKVIELHWAPSKSASHIDIAPPNCNHALWACTEGTNTNERVNREVNDQDIHQYSYDLAHAVHLLTIHNWNHNRAISHRLARFPSLAINPLLNNHQRILELSVLGEAKKDIVTGLSDWSILERETNPELQNGLKATTIGTQNTNKSAYQRWRELAAAREEGDDAAIDPELLDAKTSTLKFNPISDDMAMVDAKPIPIAISHQVARYFIKAGFYLKGKKAKEAAAQGDNIIMKLMTTEPVSKLFDIGEIARSWNMAFYDNYNEKLINGNVQETSDATVLILGDLKIPGNLFHPASTGHIIQALEAYAQAYSVSVYKHNGQGMLPITTTTVTPPTLETGMDVVVPDVPQASLTDLVDVISSNSKDVVDPPLCTVAAPKPSNRKKKRQDAIANATGAKNKEPDIKRVKKFTLFKCPECSQRRHDASTSTCNFFKWFDTHKNEFPRSKKEKPIVTSW